MNQPTLAEAIVAAGAAHVAGTVKKRGKHRLKRNCAYPVQFTITGSVEGESDKVRLTGKGIVRRENDEPYQPPRSARRILEAIRQASGPRRWRGIVETIRQGVVALERGAELDEAQIDDVDGLLGALSHKTTRTGAVKFRPEKRGVLSGARAKAPAG